MAVMIADVTQCKEGRSYAYVYIYIFDAGSVNTVKGMLVAFKSSNNLLRPGAATALFSTITPSAPIAPAHTLVAQDTSPFVFALANATGGRKCALFRAILQRPYDNSVHDKMPE